MKRIIVISLVALFVLVGAGLAMACPFQSTGDNASGPAVFIPQTGGSTSASTTPQVPTDGTSQPNG